MYGVGIRKDLIFQYDKILIEVDKKEYILFTSEAKKFINLYDSHKTVKGKTLVVVSRSLLYAREQ